MTPSAQCVIGIDLGTTNCAVAFANLAAGPDAAIIDFPIPQLERPGQVAVRSLLPSCLYIPGPHELPPGTSDLPWGASGSWIVGEFARWQGARVPGRLVSSAKSWLCHDGVDRMAPILPWGASAEVSRISPAEATTRLLTHLVLAWDQAHPEAPMSGQEVVITVPASFDEVARSLTITAAQQAGLGRLTLVEEPQAAFYDFIAHHRRELAELLRDVRLVLVVDVGGGTTDFTLICVQATAEGPELRRIAVGDHLMLGGDNMDAALARLVEGRWSSGGRKLSASQWMQLVQATRVAKERLLGNDAPEHHGIAVLGEGSRLLGSTWSSELERAETARVILDGFFPAGGVEDGPRRVARVALQELGLPYAQDPAITRHLVGFLRQHAAAAFAALGLPQGKGLPRPDAILLNGGVFNSPTITERLREVVASWWPGEPSPRMLQPNSLELAVARGAAHYGCVRRGWGRRIGGGTAHAFYVGLAPEPGDAALRAVCLIPHGHEEGESVDLNSRPFQLALGQPVQFPLYTTTSDRVDQPGDVVSVGEDLRALPPIHTVLKSTRVNQVSVPVHLRATITELGTLELWCVAEGSAERWRLEFELRGKPVEAGAPVTESLPRRFGEALAACERVFGTTVAGGDTGKEARQLVHTLEGFLGPRDTWRLSLLRELWGNLQGKARARRRSADHERAFYLLVGYTLRPGFGYPLDPWRCGQLFPLFAEGVVHRAGTPVWNEFWVMWRRIAGGLTEAQQQEIWTYLKPHLIRRILPHKAKALPKPKGIQPEGLDEMVRLAASLEHLDPSEKMELGQWIAERLKDPTSVAGPWAWALGRLGARELIHASHHKTVPPEQAAAWLSLLLRSDRVGIPGARFAVTQLARMTGDRARDLDDSQRLAVVEALQGTEVSARWQKMVREVVALDADDEAQALGDTLPIGLRLSVTV